MRYNSYFERRLWENDAECRKKEKESRELQGDVAELECLGEEVLNILRGTEEEELLDRQLGKCYAPLHREGWRIDDSWIKTMQRREALQQEILRVKRGVAAEKQNWEKLDGKISERQGENHGKS